MKKFLQQESQPAKRMAPAPPLKIPLTALDEADESREVTRHM